MLLLLMTEYKYSTFDTVGVSFYTLLMMVMLTNVWLGKTKTFYTKELNNDMLLLYKR